MSADQIRSLAFFANLMGISSAAARLWIHDGSGPRAVMVGSRIVGIEQQEIQRWLAFRTGATPGRGAAGAADAVQKSWALAAARAALAPPPKASSEPGPTTGGPSGGNREPFPVLGSRRPRRQADDVWGAAFARAGVKSSR